ncbi:hypothetical protein PUN28_005419 [Cardiocondyla obscurior]|uniref:Odorant receptor n=1 Tax=Cardiocondyla obscurior TaxID=286306 RepID=A0AAW2GJS5_9HYME
MEPTWKYYYNIPKRMLSIIGQWPYQKERRMKRFRLSLVTAFIFSMAIPQIKRLTDYLQDDWKEIKNPEECEIVRKYALTARLHNLTYCIFFVTTTNIFAMTSLIPQMLNLISPLNESRPLIMATEVYFFVNSEDYYFYILFHTILSANVMLTIIFAHDCTFMAYTEHVCGLFAVVGFRFENLSRNDSNDATSPEDCKAYNQMIGVSVHIHCRALQFAELLEETFCVTFAAQMLVIVLTLSITLLQMALQLDDIIAIMKCILYVIAQILHVFIYSLQGQKLIDHSLHIRDKIYKSRWYDIPVRSQKLLLHVMQKSLQPSYLSAGKIYVFSLKSFTTVLQSSVSYFTVLASFQ